MREVPILTLPPQLVFTKEEEEEGGRKKGTPAAESQLESERTERQREAQRER